jgi:purine-nucleoside phosphorylase
MGFRDGDRIRTTPEEIAAAVGRIRAAGGPVPRVALVLGSGLGSLAEGVEDPVVIPYADLPGFPVTSVAGHAGCLVLGTLAGVPVVIQNGRYHLYEGHSAATVGFPTRVLHAAGAAVLVVTNAAGGVGSTLAAGDLMLIEDHVLFQFRSPLRGRGPLVDGNRFVDLSRPYSRRLIALAEATARDRQLPLRRGTYWANAGPAYETPAEVRMIRKLGGDAVGMSTVPEVLTARHLGMEVLGLCGITNLAAGLSAGPLSHREVVAAAGGLTARLTDLLRALVPHLAPDPN